MKIIETKIVEINKEKRIALIFPYNVNTITLIKQIEGRKWSASNKFWHMSFFGNYLEILNEKFHGELKFRKTTPENKDNKKNTTIFPPEYVETLQLKNYIEPTIKTYRLHFQRFLKYHQKDLIVLLLQHFYLEEYH